MLDKNYGILNVPSDARDRDPVLIRFIIMQVQQMNDDFKEIPSDEIGITGK
jgi:hypothetical protein